MSTTPTNFYYHAHGSAIAGSIVRPVQYGITTAASVSLPITGGSASSSAPATTHSDPQLGNILSYASASAQVAGSINTVDDTRNTLLTITIEKLNILDTVTVDKIVAKFSAKHAKGADEADIIPLGSSIDGLKIAGHEVTVEMDHDLFHEHANYACFKQHYKADEEFRKRVRKQFLWADHEPDTPEFLKQRFQWHTEEDTPPESRGLVPCTLVKAIRHDQPNVLKTYGNVIIVPQFGKIFFGEMLMRSGSRQITMMRLELGSPVAGTLEVGTGQDNGAYWP